MQQNSGERNVNIIGLVFLLLGGLALFLVCASMTAMIYLDIFGEEAVGELTNISYRPNDSDNSFTPQISFTTGDGEEVTFLAWQGRTYFEINERIHLGGYTSTSYSEITVHYLASNPKLAKVSFAFHIEYINRVIWLFWASVTFLIGVISRRNKPIVFNLAKNK